MSETTEPTPARPPGSRRRRLPHQRAWNITARTVHLGATGILLGGHVFGLPDASLYPYLASAILSGAVLIAIEAYATPAWAHQICALVVYVKLALLCVIPFWWDARVPILLGVLALASAGAHAPRSIRHYSVIVRRVMID
jgi:hypothetical protein